MKNLRSTRSFRPCAALLGLAFLLGLSSQARAQEGLHVGLKTGLNLATYTGGAIGRQTGWQPGISTGAVLGYPLSAGSGIQLEVLYSQKGAYQAGYRHTYQNPALTAGSSTYRASLAYLDVPVLYTFGPGSNGQGLFAEVGPQLSLALHKRESVRPTGEAGSGHEETLTTDHRALVPVAAGYVAGLGYQLSNGLGAELRYSGDFTRVYRSGYGAGSLAPTASNNFHNGVLQLQVRFLFGSKKSAGPAPERRPARVRHYPPAPPVEPTQAYLDSLYRDPKVRRVIQIFSILSLVDSYNRARPVYVPGPGAPAPGRRIPTPRSQPRPRTERPTAY
ncbi:porin family protein [Hymenobacter cellulosivorans]|uniref:PorT family protein n=1 Tax=Hymenobacter cellulosivorans TaxID=2932249 RepID=A0ABY4F7Y4_9BACT|nr:porin family protein [Hymenobacter cellulosivorans]UOQ52780.1 PorT family protein [Hymenobacter cellulosivorans]